jgi:hypothetical protein
VIRAPDAPALRAFAAPFWREESVAGDTGYYGPIVRLSYSFDHQIWGANPFGFHLTNLLIHLLDCALLFVVSVRFGASPIVASLVGLLFGLFPRLSENVFWVSGRTDLLAGLFVLLAFAVYPREGESGFRSPVAAIALFFGLLSKEVAFAGVAALTALELARALAPGTAAVAGSGHASGSIAPKLRTLFTNLGPIWIALVFYLALRKAAIADSAEPPAAFALPDRLMLSAESLGRYVLMWLDPLRPALRIGAVRAPP